MNVLFLAQDRSLRAFHGVRKALSERVPIDRVGFYVSGSEFFREYAALHRDFETENVVVKEWELLERALRQRPDVERLREYEDRLGVPSLWRAIVSDRRLLWGSRFALRLDYAPRFTHEQVLAVTEETVATMESLFNAVRPDVVVSFICTRVGDYAAYLIARSRDIPFLNLRPTRIENFMTFGLTVSEPSDLVDAAYADPAWTPPTETLARAREYIRRFREGDGRYEGTLAISNKPPSVANRSATPARRRLPRVGRLVETLRRDARIRRAPPGDHHEPGVILPYAYRKVVQPWRARRVQKALGEQYVTRDVLDNMEFVFMPLHTEPEVTLLVYSRPYLNQIEVARNVAHSLPAGMTLVVKEHPAAVGKRDVGYYEKLLDIHNVRLADPGMQPRELVTRSRLVATIAGSVGLEALLVGTPVLTLGRTPYECLPLKMARRVVDLEQMDAAIVELLRHHEHDEEALERYVAAVMARSVPLNWYTGLLGRKGHSIASAAREEDTERLAAYILDALRLTDGARGGRAMPIEQVGRHGS